MSYRFQQIHQPGRLPSPPPLKWSRHSSSSPSTTTTYNHSFTDHHLQCLTISPSGHGAFWSHQQPIFYGGRRDIGPNLAQRNIGWSESAAGIQARLDAMQPEEKVLSPPVHITSHFCWLVVFRSACGSAPLSSITKPSKCRPSKWLCKCCQKLILTVYVIAVL